MRVVVRAIALGTLMAVVAAGPAAGRSTATVLDPLGDTARIDGAGSTPGFLDIASVSITKQGSGFGFSMTLAAPVPGRPVLPNQVKEIWWMWALDTDPTTFPSGFPRAPGQAFPPEFAVVLSWDGTDFTAFVVDRRATLSGGEPVLTPIAFAVGGSTVTASLPSAVVDDPATFSFSALTRAWKGGSGTEGFTFTDYLGTPGTFHPWPS
jgi:hypothetical protein